MENPAKGQAWHDDAGDEWVIEGVAGQQLFVRRKKDGKTLELKIQSIEPVEPVVKSIRFGGFTGEVCHDCGSAHMVRTGTCETCMDCGSTSKGCS